MKNVWFALVIIFGAVVLPASSLQAKSLIAKPSVGLEMSLVVTPQGGAVYQIQITAKTDRLAQKHQLTFSFLPDQPNLSKTFYWEGLLKQQPQMIFNESVVLNTVDQLMATLSYQSDGDAFAVSAIWQPATELQQRRLPSKEHSVGGEHVIRLERP